MTYIGALRQVHHWNYAEADELIIAALKKQIPKKPIYAKYRYGVPKCPNCNTTGCLSDKIDTRPFTGEWNPKFLGQKNKYCTNCGQAIDWSDEE